MIRRRAHSPNLLHRSPAVLDCSAILRPTLLASLANPKLFHARATVGHGQQTPFFAYDALADAGAHSFHGKSTCCTTGTVGRMTCRLLLPVLRMVCLIPAGGCVVGILMMRCRSPTTRTTARARVARSGSHHEPLCGVRSHVKSSGCHQCGTADWTGGSSPLLCAPPLPLPVHRCLRAPHARFMYSNWA